MEMLHVLSGLTRKVFGPLNSPLTSGSKELEISNKIHMKGGIKSSIIMPMARPYL